MSFFEWGKRFEFLLHRKNQIEDLESEMRFHQELRAAKLEREGLSGEEADYAAQRRFGNKTLIKETSVSMWSWMWLDDAVKDLRHTGKMLRQNLLFSGIAVLTLALGIGANTAIFSVINTVLLRTLPVHDPQQIYYLHVLPGQPDGAGNTGNGDSSFSEYVFEQLRTRRHVFSNLAAYVPAGINKITVRSGATPEEAAVDMVSGNFFSGLGVSSVCGRTLAMADERNHTDVAVLGFGFWNRRFARNCSVIGQPLFIKGVPFTIVGVAARNFAGVESIPTDAWIPLQKRPEFNAWGSAGENYYAAPRWWCLLLIGRLAPGVTPVRAQAMLDPAFQHAAYEHLGGKPRKGETPRKLALVPARGVGQSQDGIEKPLYVLLAMVGLILFIACGNVAMLLTARNAARRREFSIRLAIGGSQVRLFRQLLAESLILSQWAPCLGGSSLSLPQECWPPGDKSSSASPRTGVCCSLRSASQSLLGSCSALLLFSPRF
jgi:predicted permease